MSIEAKDVIPNAFLDNLGTDWVGVNAHGHIIARAQDQETVLKCGDPGEIVAAFSAEHLFPAKSLPPAAVEGEDPGLGETPIADTPPSSVPAVENKDVVPVAAPKAPAKKPAAKKKKS